MSDDQNLELEDQEREEILEEIDELVATNRLPVSDDMEKLKPQKSGVGFPLIINLFAVAAVVSTFYFSARLFEERQEVLSEETATYLSAEGKLLEELKKESAEKLTQKDAEIGAIQDELAELDRQSKELVNSMDQQIADREAELRIALQAELEEERAKLKAQGKSESAIEEELYQIEQQRSSEYEAELAAFRSETEVAIAKKEEELSLAIALNEELLAEVNSEKERIQTETLQRENELTAQFEAEKAALAEEAASAEAQLEALTANQAKESLILSQINSSYESIFDQIEAGNMEEALKQLNVLKELINNPAIATLPSIQARSTNDREMLDIIRQTLEEQAYKEDIDITSLSAAAELLLSAQEIAGRGTTAYRAGNTADAEGYYIRSLEKIPALKQAWQNLDEIEKNAESERLIAYLAEGRALEERGMPDQAALQYAEAASSAFSYNPELLRQAVTGIIDASSLSITGKEEELAELEKRLEQLEKTYNIQLAEVRADYETQLTGKDTVLADTVTDYEARLVEAGVGMTAIEGEMNEELDRLTRLVGERDQENLRLNAEKEEIEASLAEAQKTIEDGRAYISELEASSESGIEALRAQMTAEIADLKAASAEEIADLRSLNLEDSEGVRNAASAEIEDLKTESESEIAEAEAEAAAQIAEFQAESDRKLAELNDKLASTEKEYAELEEKFNNAQETLSSRLRSSQVTGYNTGLKQGRSTALQDILSFTSYLDGSEEIDSAAEARIAELSATEALYGETIQKIQAFAADSSGADRTEILTIAQPILIGTISYASGNSIIIEPLTDRPLESGTRIAIKRKERGKDEYYITFGIITSATQRKISARTDPAGELQAQSMDLVYITEQP